MLTRRFVGIFVAIALVFSASHSNAETDFSIGGVYTAWMQSQHNFTFTDEAYDHEYAIQMLRFNMSFSANEYITGVTRFDIAQGWWGVDNALRSVQRTNIAGGSALFDFKDTNFLLHVDQAYVDFTIPNTELGFKVGRMWYGHGNRLVLDNNLDGIQFGFSDALNVGYAKVSEGVDALSDDDTVGPDQRGFTDARDADLFTVNFSNALENFTYDAFAMYYNDASTSDNNAYVPDHLQYFKTRFSPQVTQLITLGFAGDLTLEKLTLTGEFDYLIGQDDINNTVYGGAQMWDINNGNLSGYNLYLKANYAASDALNLGGVFGMGSGDDDKSDGKGNVNKLRTSGFFYLTEIWEDSIMPDEEGITPQGLGAPNVRGYRELENTTALQVNGSYKVLDTVTGFLSYTYLGATQPIQAWQSDGEGDWEFLDRTSNYIGQEVDFRITYAPYQALNLILRGGYFIPGDGAAYLINGNATNKEDAWELKGMVTYKF